MTHATELSPEDQRLLTLLKAASEPTRPVSSGGGSRHPPSHDSIDQRLHFLRMNGTEIFKLATRAMADSAIRVIEQADLTMNDISCFIPHQANIRIIESLSKHAGISMDRVYTNIDRYGNTSAGSIPMALDECVREGRVGPGSIVLMVTFGGGLTWASTVVRW